MPGWCNGQAHPPSNGIVQIRILIRVPMLTPPLIMKTATIEIPIYETPTGKPTCATNFLSRKVCPFLQSTRMGTGYKCFWDNDGGQLMDTDGGQEGFFVPSKCCPLHKKNL